MCLEYGRPLIVPTTLVNPAYRDEIFGAVGAAGVDLPHVFIEVPADELRRRIDGQVLMPGEPPAEGGPSVEVSVPPTGSVGVISRVSVGSSRTSPTVRRSCRQRCGT